MTNDMYTEKISLWLDDELSTTEIADLHNHMAVCIHCQQTYEAMRHIDQLLSNAATVMVAPLPGFSRRVEARLGHYQPQKLWQIWLAVTVLITGAFVLLGMWVLMSGVTLLSMGNSLLDTSLAVRGVVMVIDSLDNFRFLLNLGALAFKTSFLTMRQPLFWGCVIIAVAMAGLWVRLMRVVIRRGTTYVEMLI